ncbi:MAG: hypothetical protein FLDDKLPJ_02100 [Phycisphaerae bacterium]|nr:hypothetical protein [Phycisphaerae bacterium]
MTGDARTPVRAALSLTAWCAAAAQSPPPVAVEGGADPSGQVYAWRLVNRSDKPVARIAFPHFHADLFTPPSGWGQNCTYLVNQGVPDRPGVCEAVAPEDGWLPGATADITMRIAASGAVRAPGRITITFTDGGVAHVDGVELPHAPSHLERFVPLMAFGAVIAIVLIRRALRRVTNAAAPDARSTGGNPPSV